MSLDVPGFLVSVRLAEGLSLADFARRWGVSRSTVSRWERGLRTPRRLQLAAWAEAYPEVYKGYASL